MQYTSPEELIHQIDVLLNTQKSNTVFSLLQDHKSLVGENTVLSILYTCGAISESEKKAGQVSIYEKIDSVSLLAERFTAIKFFLRRIDFGVQMISKEELIAFIEAYQMSGIELVNMIQMTMVHPEKMEALL